MENIPKNKLPKCKGKKYCPLKIDHGIKVEVSLGCSICRNAKANAKEF